jgi:hypothetical protein
MDPNKVVVIYGPRRSGKTTLVKEIISEVKDDYLFISGDDRQIKNWLGSQSIEILKQNVGNKKLLIIDEAQQVNNIGLNLKLMVDHIDGIKIIATGSSSFDLANQVGEPLVGRKWQYTLYPIAQLELALLENRSETETNLEYRLIYGSYPEVLVNNDISYKVQILNSIIDNYLFKDILEYEGIKKSNKILDLLRLLAFQIGKEVSLTELGNQLNLDQKTVEKYLDLLEKVFVIKRVFGYSGNLRKEVTKSSRFYFFDNGIRNAIINNFNPLNIRNDIGMLWENYLFMERIKRQAYLAIYANTYFWRTYDQKEVDMVEERDGKLFGFEFKWSDKASKSANDWLKTYDNAEFETINKSNYLEFIT